MDNLANWLKAAADHTRLRILALCAQGELTVTELTRILGQSQPRVSHHLKVLCDSGLLERLPEGSWAFYRVPGRGDPGRFATRLVEAIPASDPVGRADGERLATIRQERARAADDFFRANAQRWDEIRSLHVDDREVEGALLELIGPGQVADLLDIGTGTGRMLQVFGARGVRGIGLDLSHAMLSVARANLARSGLRDCYVRHGDMYRLPWPAPTFDAVTIHQVLHYADRPAEVIAEAARVLRPGGRLVVADFTKHELDYLHREFQHRRLGFEDDEMLAWVRSTGLEPGRPVHLPGGKLTVGLWSGVRRENQEDRR